MASSAVDAHTDSEDEAASHPVEQKRKKAPPKERQFSEVNRWCTDDHSKEQIFSSIRDNIDAINRAAGMPKRIVGLHQDRDSRWGVFSCRRKWPSAKNTIMTYMLSCPYRDSHGCECEIRIVESAAIVSMSVSCRHTAADHHESRDKSKKLKKHQLEFIAESVKVAPLQVHITVALIYLLVCLFVEFVYSADRA